MVVPTPEQIQHVEGLFPTAWLRCEQCDFRVFVSSPETGRRRSPRVVAQEAVDHVASHLSHS